MAIQVSTALRDSLLGTEALATTLNDGFIKIYAGTPPTGADEGETGTLLVTITDNDQGAGAGQGLDFEAAAVSGVLAKLTAQIWSGTVGVTGVATHYRFMKQADTGLLSTTEPRLQGTVDTSGADLNLSNTSLTASGLQTIDAYSITMPTP